jgi:hypothetical protein
MMWTWDEPVVTAELVDWSASPLVAREGLLPLQNCSVQSQTSDLPTRPVAEARREGMFYTSVEGSAGCKHNL